MNSVGRPLAPGLLALALAPLASGCAGPQVDLATLERRIRAACDPVAAIRLPVRAPLRTNVPAGLTEVRTTLAGGDATQAERRAAAIADSCREEAQPRRDLLVTVRQMQRDRERIPDKYYAHFLALIARADYSNAVVCAEGLLEGNAARCDLAPPDKGRTEPILLHREPAPPAPPPPDRIPTVND